MSERRLLAGLLAAAAAARLLYCWGFSPFEPAAPVSDISWYHSFALSLREHGALLHDGKPSAAREPVYPIFLAGVYSIFGASNPAVWLAQTALGLAIVAMVFSLAERVFSRNVAWAAAVLAAFHPQFIFYTAQPEREILQIFLLLAAVLLMVLACRGESAPLMAGSAVLWAFCPLINSALLPAGLLAAGGAWLLGRRRGRDLRGLSALYLAVFLAIYALWPLRNYLVFHRFIAGATAGGAHVYVSLVVPNDAAGTALEKEYIDQDPVMRASSALPEDERDEYFYRAAARWVANHPLRFAGIMLASGIKLWRLYPYSRDYGVSARVVQGVSLLSDGWIIPLGLAGLLLAGRRFPEADLFNLVLFAITLTYMIFWAVIRYRLPMMPYVLIYAGYALERLAQRFAPGRLPFAVSRPA